MDTIWGTSLLDGFAARAHDAGWVGTWKAVAFLGSSTFFVVLLPLVLATLRARAALPFTIAVLGSGLLTEWLKHAVARPRLDPATFGAPILESADTFGVDAFPSGHALMAVVVWGWTASRRPFPGATWVAGLLVAAIATSRLTLLRHDLLDVGAGLAIGSVALLALVTGERRLRELWHLPWVEQAGLWLLLAGIAQAVLGTDATAILAGVLGGAGAGTAWVWGMRRASRVDLTRRLARGALALAGVAAIRWAASDLTGWTLFWTYAGAGFWVAGLVPRGLGGPIRD